MGLEIYSYVDWVRAERRLVRGLGALIKWGWAPVTRDRKKKGTSFGTMPTGRSSWQSRKNLILVGGSLNSSISARRLSFIILLDASKGAASL